MALSSRVQNRSGLETSQAEEANGTLTKRLRTPPGKQQRAETLEIMVEWKEIKPLDFRIANAGVTRKINQLLRNWRVIKSLNRG